MDLVNSTPAQAKVYVSAVSDTVRLGHVVAKLTFRVDQRGGVRVEADEARPVLDVEGPSSFGDIPRDLVWRRASWLDVVLLGTAYAPGGKAVHEMMVTMQIGDHVRQIR